MMGRSTDWLLALLGGALLALMINYNSLLAKHTTPVFASWMAHAFGAIAAFFIIVIHMKVFGGKKPMASSPRPLWFYLGGVPGAFTVILAGITVNSSLNLSGTISLMLVGQILFGILSDYFGFFGLAKRKILSTDFFVVFSVLTGSALIIFGRP